MTQESNKSNIILIVAIIGVLGTIVGAIINVIGNYNVEKLRQEAELTRMALVSIATQGGATQVSMASTISAPTSTPYPTNEPLPTYTSYPTYTPVPLPTISPTPSVSLPFTDNFDMGARPEWGEEKGNWLVANGKYTITDIKDWTTGISTIGDHSWTNYAIRATVDLQLGCGNNRVGFLVRVQDTRNFLALKVYDGITGCYVGVPLRFMAWYVVKDGEWSEISNTRYEDFPHDNPFTLTVQVNGNFITTLVNNEQVLSLSNSSFSSGKVGIYIESNAVRTATFDDFSVEALPTQ